MPSIKLVGSNFTKILGERKTHSKPDLEIETNIQIDSLDLVSEAENTLKIGYSFLVDYKERGNIEISGFLFISTDLDSAKKIQKNWKDKKLDTPEITGITNLILQKASIKAFEIEDELALPIHLRLPYINLKK